MAEREEAKHSGFLAAGTDKAGDKGVAEMARVNAYTFHIAKTRCMTKVT